MSLYKFKNDDIFYSKVKMYPENSFFFYEGVKYYNDRPIISGNLTNVVGGVPSGYLSLYELNVDRNAALDTYNADTNTGTKHLIRPFVYKTNNSYMSVFKKVTTSSFFAKTPYLDSNGDLQMPIITGSYPLSASVTVTHYAANSSRPHIQSLKNVMNSYRTSPHYQYSSSIYSRDFDNITTTMVDVPSIFYGHKIKKGSVDLKLYISGTLTAQLNDSRRNGELVQVGPINSLNSGSVCGIVLYNEGVLLLTSSVALNSLHTENYLGASDNPKWIHFGTNTSASWNSTPSSSFALEFKGVETTPTITMLVHARKNELNFTNNLSAIESGSIENPITSSNLFLENAKRKSKNMVSSSFATPTGSFERVTYISGVKIFDKDKKLIGVAKFARPIKKTENREFTTKIKYDL